MVPARHPNSPPNATGASRPLLDVAGLTVDLPVEHGVVNAVRGISFHLNSGETLAVVGESGSGKTVAALSMLGLLPHSARVGGVINFDGHRLDSDPQVRRNDVAGRRIAMVFQDPMTALNPVRSVGSQLVEVIRRHQPVSRSHARTMAVAALDRVRIPNAEQRFSSYVHELSGGMRQRVMIALAMINNPDVLLADEPTTALDVTVAAQILDLLGDLRDDHGTAILLITHDLGMVSDFADRVMVMYAGKIAETADTRRIFTSPEMPYTVGLLACTPSVHHTTPRLRTITGSPPSLLDPPAGCAFADRCPLVIDRCRTQEAALTARQTSDSGNSPDDSIEPHLAACHRRDIVRQLADRNSIFDAAAI